jgi:hypothetical protein
LITDTLCNITDLILSTVYTWTVVASDGFASTIGSTWSFTTKTIGEENQAPTANDQSVTTEQDQSVDITLTGSDPQNDTLTFISVSSPSSGSLDPGSIGSTHTYDPNPGFTGSASFTFKVNDGSFDSNTATVSITVTQPGGGGGNCIPTNQGCGAGPCQPGELHFAFSGSACTGSEPACIPDQICTGGGGGSDCSYQCLGGGPVEISGDCSNTILFCSREIAP